MDNSPSSDQPGSTVEVTFSISSSDYPFIVVSESKSCRFELAKIIPRQDGQYAEFFNVTGVDPTRILDLTDAHEAVDVTLLCEYDRGGLFEFTVGQNCPAVTLSELGALPRDVNSCGGNGYIVAEIPPQCDASTVIEAFLDEIPEAELTSKHQKDGVTPLFTPSSFQHVLRSNLTDRQLEILRAAFDAGYYDWPRECTGEEIAEEFDITSSTFSEHIHAAERKLLTALFDDSIPADLADL